MIGSYHARGEGGRPRGGATNKAVAPPGPHPGFRVVWVPWPLRGPGTTSYVEEPGGQRRVSACRARAERLASAKQAPWGDDRQQKASLAGVLGVWGREVLRDRAEDGAPRWVGAVGGWALGRCCSPGSGRGDPRESQLQSREGSARDLLQEPPGGGREGAQTCARRDAESPAPSSGALQTSITAAFCSSRNGAGAARPAVAGAWLRP